VSRRLFLKLAGIGAAWAALSAHAPYRQWYRYRKERLFIVTTAAEEQSLALGEAIAEVLAQRLPDSKAMATRTQDAVGMIKLLSSQQLDVGLLLEQDAAQALRGEGKFRREGATNLGTLAGFAPFVLVCRDDYSKRQAYRIAKALGEARARIRVPGLESAAFHPQASVLPIHPGASAFYTGGPEPDVEANEVLLFTNKEPLHPHAAPAR
jgi:TRAP-type uncharacterized transport system substrate-binding protein